MKVGRITISHIATFTYKNEVTNQTEFLLFPPSLDDSA